MTTTQITGDHVRHRIQTAFISVIERTLLAHGQASRRLLVDKLQDRLGPFPLRENQELRPQAAELVRACTKVPGGLQTLVDLVEQLELATEEIVELRRLHDEWDVADILTSEDWGYLRPALEDFYPSNLTVLCQRATEHRLPGPPPWCTNAWQVFVHLAGQNAGPDGLSPSLAFLALLEDHVDELITRHIRIRNRRLASEQGLTRQLDSRRARLREGSELPMDSSAYLVIQVEPRLDPDGSEDVYALSTFLQWRGPEAWYSRLVDWRIVRRRDLEREVEQLIEHMENVWSDRTSTVIVEFVLPWELLNAEVDWWQKEINSPRPIVLTMDYPVVVRSLERLRTPRWHRVWHQRWLQLQTAPASSVVHWSRPNGSDYFTRLETELKADDRVVSLVLSEPPIRPGDIGQQEIVAALRAGLPVIIWHRDDRVDPAFREAVTTLLANGGLARLPLHAWELRRQALRLEPALRMNHIGRHLTILWDDPERRPEPLETLARGTPSEPADDR